MHGTSSPPATSPHRSQHDRKECHHLPEATDLKPLVVTFHPSGNETNPEVSIEVNDLYAFRRRHPTGREDPSTWCSRSPTRRCLSSTAPTTRSRPSEAAHEVLYLEELTDANGGTWNQNNSFCYTCPLTAEGNKQNVKAELNKVFDLHCGADSDTRNSYLWEYLPAATLSCLTCVTTHFLHPKNNY